MAYDSDRHVTLLFGGEDTNGVILGDTWEWNGSTWIQLPTTGSAINRTLSAMVYDPMHRKFILSCGLLSQSSGQLSGATWVLDLSAQPLAWVNQNAAAPGGLPRRSHAMVYDSFRNEIVLFGGDTNAAEQSNDTYVWDWSARQWISRTSVNRPRELRAMAMAYDSHRQRIVLFGGKSGDVACPTPTYSETWEWNGVAWSAPSLLNAPPDRAFHAMAFDPLSRRSIVFGGQNDNQCGLPALSDTWAYTGTGWCDVFADEPSGRSAVPMVFDLARREVVLFGGTDRAITYGDTWTLRTYCRADFNCSGAVNSQDFFEFLVLFFPQDPRADFNCDGAINSQDFFDFTAALFEGC